MPLRGIFQLSIIKALNKKGLPYGNPFKYNYNNRSLPYDFNR
jgi:hypothetical protein